MVVDSASIRLEVDLKLDPEAENLLRDHRRPRKQRLKGVGRSGE